MLSLQFSFLFASNSNKISGRKGEEDGGEGDEGEGDNGGIGLFGCDLAVNRREAITYLGYQRRYEIVLVTFIIPFMERKFIEKEGSYSYNKSNMRL
jgi:hypothetical protein